MHNISLILSLIYLCIGILKIRVFSDCRLVHIRPLILIGNEYARILKLIVKIANIKQKIRVCCLTSQLKKFTNIFKTDKRSSAMIKFMIHVIHIFQTTQVYTFGEPVDSIFSQQHHIPLFSSEKQLPSSSQLYIHLIIFKLQQLVLVRQFQSGKDMEIISRKKRQPLTEQWGKNTKTDKIVKKKKKNSQDSPNKLMKTPEKKRKKAEDKEELQVNTQSCSQTLDFFRHKEPETARPSQNHKKIIKNDNKKKPIPNSPADLHHSHSASLSKHKRSSRSKSATKMSTHRSTMTESKPHLPKTSLKVNHNETSKDTGKAKLKKKLKTSTSRQKIHCHTEIKPLISQSTPLKGKNGKEFDVANRDQVYVTVPKQSDKQKLKLTLFDSELEDIQTISPLLQKKEQQERKVKLKKLVPTIRTEYSQRRGSYFDEEKLRRMENFHKSGKRVEIAPSLLIRSARKEEMKIVPQTQMILQIEGQNHQKSMERDKNQDEIEQFKRQQEMRWRQMLEGLHDLKNGQQFHQKIDQLINQLNQNYLTPHQQLSESAIEKPNEIQIERNYKDKAVLLQKQKHSLTQLIEIDQNEIIQGKKDIKLMPIFQYKSQTEAVNSEEITIQDIIWNSSFKNLSNSPINEVLFEQYHPSQEQKNQQENKEKAIKKDENISSSKIAIHKISEEKRSNLISMSDFYNYTQQKNELGLKEEILAQRQLVCSTGNVIAFKKKGIRQQLDEQAQEKAIIEADVSKKDNLHELDRKDANQLNKIDEEVFPPLQPPPSLERTYEQQSSSLLLSPIRPTAQIQQSCTHIQNILLAEFSNTILRSSLMLHNFLIAYQNIIDTPQIYEQGNIQIECSLEYSMKLLCVLLSFLNRKYGCYLLEQVRLAFECRPIDVLRYIRGVEEQEEVWIDSALKMPLLDGGIIEVFETVELTNPSYRPDYFSYHHCLYDLFNDVVDELRPYGNRGKAIFSHELGIAIPDLTTLSKKVKERFLSVLRGEDENQQINWKVSEQGIFEVIYYLSLELVEIIINQDILAMHRVMRRNC